MSASRPTPLATACLRRRLALWSTITGLFALLWGLSFLHVPEPRNREPMPQLRCSWVYKQHAQYSVIAWRGRVLLVRYVAVPAHEQSRVKFFEPGHYRLSLAEWSGGELSMFRRPHLSIDHRLGFLYETRADRGGGFSIDEMLAIGFPLWLPAALTSIPLVLALRQLRTVMMRARMGLCVRCGYDLRASGEHCPECGATVVR
jgi:hypothetical protein